MELNKLLSRGVGQTQEVSGSHFLFLPADQLLWKVLRLKKKKNLGGKLNKERHSEELGTNFGRLPCLWEASSGSYWIRVLVETTRAKEGSGFCFFYLGSSGCSSWYRWGRPDGLHGNTRRVEVRKAFSIQQTSATSPQTSPRLSTGAPTTSPVRSRLFCVHLQQHGYLGNGWGGRKAKALFPLAFAARVPGVWGLRGGLSPPSAGLGRAGHSALEHKAKQAGDSSHHAAAAGVEAQQPDPRKASLSHSSRKEVQSCWGCAWGWTFHRSKGLKKACPTRAHTNAGMEARWRLTSSKIPSSPSQLSDTLPAPSIHFGLSPGQGHQVLSLFSAFPWHLGAKGRAPRSLGEGCRTPDFLQGQGLLPLPRHPRGRGMREGVWYQPGKLRPGEAPSTDDSGLHIETNFVQSLKELNQVFIYWSKTSTGREGLLFWQLSQWTLLPCIQMHQKAPWFWKK